jgi:hypothetical protein
MSGNLCISLAEAAREKLRSNLKLNSYDINFIKYIGKLIARTQDFLHGPAFRHIIGRNFTLIPFLADIKVTIATPVFPNILYAIHTRADNVLIPGAIPTEQPAGTAHVTVSFLISQKPPQ